MEHIIKTYEEFTLNESSNDYEVVDYIKPKSKPIENVAIEDYDGDEVTFGGIGSGSANEIDKNIGTFDFEEETLSTIKFPKALGKTLFLDFPHIKNKLISFQIKPFKTIGGLLVQVKKANDIISKNMNSLIKTYDAFEGHDLDSMFIEDIAIYKNGDVYISTGS